MTRFAEPVDRMRWMALAASTIIALAFALAVAISRAQVSEPSSSPAAPAPAGSRAALDPRIARLARTQPGRSLETIVQFNPRISAAQARTDVSRTAGIVFGQLHIIPALAVRLSAAHARELSMNPDVHSVSLNAAIKGSGSVSSSNLQTTYPQTLNLPPLWNAGGTGSGVGVAVIDTGIAGDLPDFQSPSGGSRVVETAITNPAATTAYDTFGHGTDVAGIIAGSSPNGQYIGVAPGASLISIKASDETGTATVLNVIYGLQFAVDHKADYNLRVVNLSLDETTPQSYTSDPLDAAAESAWMHGLVVVVAAGNRGSASDAVQYAPANDPYVITVGAIDESGTAGTSDDSIAAWSSRGTTQDGFQKPDVYAPGAHIVSVLAPNSAFANMCPTCIVGGSYIRTSGTSMAAPMISGLVADVLQTHPSWTPNLVKAALTSAGAYSNPALKEIDANRLNRLLTPAPADQGLTPNNLITDSAGDINYSLSSWSLSSWSTATGAQSAGFSLSSWSCTCTGAGTASTNPSLSSWSLSSWSTLDPLVDNPGVVRGTSSPQAKAIADAAAYAAQHPRH